VAGALWVAAGCTNTNNNAPPEAGSAAPSLDGPRLAPARLWYAGAGLDAFTNAEVERSNDGGPSYLVVTDIDVNFHDVAFDAQGNLWAIPIAAQKAGRPDRILRLPASAIAGGTLSLPDLVITSPALAAPQSLAFDGDGALWVTNFDGTSASVGSIVRFDHPGDQAGSVTLAPAATIGPGPTAAERQVFSQPSGLAFDAAGNLWLSAIGSVARLDHATTLVGAVTAAPSAILTSGDDAFDSIAFDAAGSLWITGAGGGFFALRVASPGSLTGTARVSPAAKLRLPSDTPLFAAGMAFDADGALWVAMSDRIVELSGAGALTGEVTPTPATVLTLKAAFPDLSSKLVFRPKPGGLPIFF
jgi:sugar lactone lactonase YvrE